MNHMEYHRCCARQARVRVRFCIYAWPGGNSEMSASYSSLLYDLTISLTSQKISCYILHITHYIYNFILLHIALHFILHMTYTFHITYYLCISYHVSYLYFILWIIFIFPTVAHQGLLSSRSGVCVFRV